MKAVLSKSKSPKRSSLDTSGSGPVLSSSKEIVKPPTTVQNWPMHIMPTRERANIAKRIQHMSQIGKDTFVNELLKENNSMIDSFHTEGKGQFKIYQRRK